MGDLKKWLKNGEKVAPSVTTILDVLAKPALVNWVANKYIDKAYELNPANYQNVSLWNDAVRYKSDSEMEQAPKAGTDFHKLMELFTKKELDINHPQYDLCRKVGNVVFDKTDIGIEYWQPEVNIFSPLGYAGQADLVINCRDFDSQTDEQWVIDYKTKETADKFKPGKMAYDNHAQQLAAYASEISPTCRCANVFVCLETGEIDWYEWSDEDLMRGFEVFTRCVEIYYLVNKL